MSLYNKVVEKDDRQTCYEMYQKLTNLKSTENECNIAAKKFIKANSIELTRFNKLIETKINAIITCMFIKRFNYNSILFRAAYKNFEHASKQFWIEIELKRASILNGDKRTVDYSLVINRA